MPTKCPDVKTQSSLISEVSAPPQPVMNVFEPFIHEGLVSLSSDMSNPTTIKILRDTGASQSLLLSDTSLFSEESSVGANVLIRGNQFFRIQSRAASYCLSEVKPCDRTRQSWNTVVVTI